MRPNSSSGIVPPIASSVSPPGGDAPLLGALWSAVEQEKMERIKRYSSPEFTRQLLEHMHKAKKKAIVESEEPQK